MQRRVGWWISVAGDFTSIARVGGVTRSPSCFSKPVAGDFSVGWSLVQPDVARFSRVCSYDRAGLGWSESGPGPRTLRQIVWELRTLLDKAGETGRFLIVGNGYGGLSARLFAFTYPQAVAGIVLIDSVYEEDILDVRNGKLTRLTEAATGQPVPPTKMSLQTGETGIAAEDRSRFEATVRQMAPLALQSPYDKLAADAQRMRAWSWSQIKHWTASNDNPFMAEELASLLARQTAGAYPLGDLPLIVVSRSPGRGTDDYMAHQERLRTLVESRHADRRNTERTRDA